mmetsp:Transcript_2170/g.4472  ORF Transcript_2170/g.4472 Transcript_2170/m.4472 type:complete len:164 (+) Transcript_2170:127-618(+)
MDLKGGFKKLEQLLTGSLESCRQLSSELSERKQRGDDARSIAAAAAEKIKALGGLIFKQQAILKEAGVSSVSSFLAFARTLPFNSADRPGYLRVRRLQQDIDNVLEELDKSFLQQDVPPPPVAGQVVDGSLQLIDADSGKNVKVEEICAQSRFTHFIFLRHFA